MKTNQLQTKKNGNKPTENKSIEIKATVPAVPVNTTAIQEKRGRLSFEERLKKQMESYFAQPPEIEKPHGEDVKTPNNSGKDVGELGAVGGATPSSPVGDDSRALFKKWSEEEAEKKLQEIILKDIEEKNKNKNEQESIDFTLDETEMALKDCAGWCGQLTEFEVFKKCSKSLKDEGCYIVWFWLKRKRPSISVTKNGKLKTYTIHKKTATESESRSYFIYEGQHKAPNMAKLVEHHTQEGLTDETVSTDNTVKFTTPL